MLLVKVTVGSIVLAVITVRPLPFAEVCVPSLQPNLKFALVIFAEPKTVSEGKST